MTAPLAYRIPFAVRRPLPRQHRGGLLAAGRAGLGHRAVDVAFNGASTVRTERFSLAATARLGKPSPINITISRRDQ
ncbi:hypothetical protein [Mycobacterium parmense]|uniref:hypothetical protein n=1 Tax=Mycobacterium parmense TaxID=185642 RepID=UPI00137478DA|nr:hypothetical protein [Mycobacterium parmense]MCV7352181.1 hypothetical protein [Mycobacterium parmense]